MAHLIKGRRQYPGMNPSGSGTTNSNQGTSQNQSTSGNSSNNPFANSQQQNEQTYGSQQQGGYPNQDQQAQYQQQNYQKQQQNYQEQQQTQQQYAKQQHPQSNHQNSHNQSHHQSHQSQDSQQSTQSQQQMKTSGTAKRKGSKNKQIDSDKIPRPEINSESTHQTKDFVTTSLGNPPSSYQTFRTVDEGCAGPRYLRSTYYKIPAEESLIKDTGVPLGFIVQPLADPTPDEDAIPIANYGEEGPIRCSRCRGYINPAWIYSQNGSVGICNLCKMSNQLPREYYSPLDEQNLRTDKNEKPELSKGVYEFVAPSGYHQRALVTPNIVICLDISSSSYMTGIFHQVLSSLSSLLDYIPSPELTKIAITTYDSCFHLFKVPDDLTKEITIINCPEVDDACIPYPLESLFLNVANDREKIDYLIQRIQSYYESNEKLTQKGAYASCFGAALNNCVHMLFKDAGRVLIFSTQAPVNGLGKIKKRDDFKLYGTEKEKTLFVPQCEDYSRAAKTCLERRICVDLFCFANDYFDLSTIGEVCNISGGNIYYYPTYDGNYDGEKMHYDLARNLTRYVGYDAVMTVRASQGLIFQEYVLPRGRRPMPELEMSCLDADTAINVFLNHEEKLSENDDAHIQVAVLYTNPYGERVIRVINFKANTSKDLVAIFRSCDVETVGQLLIKKNIHQITSTPIKTIRTNLTNKLVDVLYNYRIHCATSSNPAQLILPESLKILPIFFLAAFKAKILALSDSKPDDRAYDLHRFTKMPLNVLSTLWYPKLYPIHTLFDSYEMVPGSVNEDTQKTILPSNIACTDEKIDDNGIFLLDNSEQIYVYVKADANVELIQHLFGVESFEEVKQLTSFPSELETDYFYRINNIIDGLRASKNATHQSVRIVPEGDKFENHFLNLLMEDERMGLGESYSNYLCNIHKMIQNKYN